MILQKRNRIDNAEEKAYRYVINLILNGEARPGEFLFEEELSENLDMSRTPVSRALTRLVTEGFLDKLPKKGCFVPTPTPEDAESIFEARVTVESKNAFIAAKLATDHEIEELETEIFMDKQAVDSFSKESYSSINESFHLKIAKITGNPYLERWTKYIFWRSSLYVFYFDSFYIASTLTEALPQLAPDQHLSIMRAIKDHDQEAAGLAMERHIRKTFARLFARKR
jgi:DNA-binding GntR family transcriptional regulator